MRLTLTGEVMVPKFEVNPLWPKPLPSHWILGMTVGVAVDAHDNVWIALPAASPDDEGNPTSLATRLDCCKAAPDCFWNLIRSGT